MKAAGTEDLLGFLGHFSILIEDLGRFCVQL